MYKHTYSCSECRNTGFDPYGSVCTPCSDNRSPMERELYEDAELLYTSRLATSRDVDLKDVNMADLVVVENRINALESLFYARESVRETDELPTHIELVEGYYMLDTGAMLRIDRSAFGERGLMARTIECLDKESKTLVEWHFRPGLYANLKRGKIESRPAAFEDVAAFFEYWGLCVCFDRPGSACPYCLGTGTPQEFLREVL